MSSTSKVPTHLDCAHLARQKPLCAHEVQFYESDGFLVSAVVEFARPALEAGGSAILIATGDHRAPILRELTIAGIPGETLLHRCFALDAEETLASFMRRGRPDAALFSEIFTATVLKAQEAGAENAPIAAFGEMVAVLWARGERQAAMQLEQLWNSFSRKFSFSLLCAYPLRDFCRHDDRQLFTSICAEHSSVRPAETFAGSANESQKARSIAELQQQAEALKSEIAARIAAEAQLQGSHAQLEKRVEERTQALRKLSLHLLNVQDAERRRIARELHDALGQDFAGLRMNLDMARRSPHRTELWEQCDRVLDHCIREVRTLSYLLHPPMIEEAGFLPAAEWYINDFTRRSGTPVTLDISENVGRPPAAAQLVLFRILQDSLLSIHRQPHVTSARVLVRRSADNIVLEISADGSQIQPEKLAFFNRHGEGMGVGLTAMWERVRDLGGSVELANLSPGSVIRVYIPLPRKRRKPSHVSSISNATTEAAGNS
jgi:signal transduction histidine kinase